MNWLADDVTINTSVFVVILGVAFTITLGVLGWAIKKLIDVTVLQARMTEQLDDVERRVGVSEGDIRMLADRFLPSAYRRPPNRNRPSPGT